MELSSTSTRKKWIDWAVILTVYSLSGTAAMLFSRLVLNEILAMEGNMITGSWLYRGVYLLLIPPFYSVVLVAIGTVFGRREYFTKRVLKIWGAILK